MSYYRVRLRNGQYLGLEMFCTYGVNSPVSASAFATRELALMWARRTMGKVVRVTVRRR